MTPWRLDMPTDIPHLPEGEAEQDTGELLAHADALAKKVEKLPDGPTREN
jgi:hypothetical protein